MGTILSVDGASTLLQRGPDGKLPPTLFDDQLLLCDGRPLDSTKYPILAQIIGGTNPTLPPFTKSGCSLYCVGPDTNGFAGKINEYVFEPFLDYFVDLTNPLTGYKDNYTVLWVVPAIQPTSCPLGITIGEVCDRFGVSLSTVNEMNGRKWTIDTCIPGCLEIDPNKYLGNIIKLPNLPSVLNTLYCRLPEHEHELKIPNDAQTGPYTYQCTGNTTFVVDGFPNNVVHKTKIVTDTNGNPKNPDTYKPFSGYTSTIAVAYYIVGG